MWAEIIALVFRIHNLEAQATTAAVKHYICMTGFMKTVSIICAKSPIFHLDFTSPKGSFEAVREKNRERTAIKDKRGEGGKRLAFL